MNDTWFPVSGRHRVVREVGAVYRTLGAADRFEHEARITAHGITEAFGDRVIAWFDRYLWETPMIAGSLVPPSRVLSRRGCMGRR